MARPAAPIVSVTRTGRGTSTTKEAAGKGAAAETQEANLAELTRDPAVVEAAGLARMRDRLRSELRAFKGKPENTLNDAERLTKHDLEVKLMALYFLLDEKVALKDLLESVQAPQSPGEVHSLLRAAVYHRLGSEGLRDRALRKLVAGNEAEPFDLIGVELCSAISRSGRWTRHETYEFTPDQELHIYGELLNLTALPGADGFRSEVAIEVLLLDESGRERDRRRLGPKGVLADLSPEAREKNFFAHVYRLPMRVTPGNYRLVVSATDRNARRGTNAQQEIPIQIHRKP